MEKILRKISNKERFFEIIDSMKNPICALYSINTKTVGVAENYNGICIYEYTPAEEELEEFEIKIKKYIYRK